MHRRGFTLIELLIVVAIIAILAAIAVPNFLEAQTRAKVSRAQADMRTIATALESYAVDQNSYPLNDGNFNVIPIDLSTPIAYLTNTNLKDPFNEKEYDPVYGDLIQYYTYTLVVTQDQANIHDQKGRPPPFEAVDSPFYNPGAFDRYGKWRLVSFGPDRDYNVPGAPMGAFNPNPVTLKGSDIPYDPTNGTVSYGNTLRTHKHNTQPVP